MRLTALFSSSVLLALSFDRTVAAGDAPIIGILSVPLDAAEQPCLTLAERLGLLPVGNGVNAAAAHPAASSHTHGGAASPSCFTAFYPKWIESSGARAVIIPYNAPNATLDLLFSSVNGILFTGGGAILDFNHTYLRTANYLFQKVLAANSAGDFMPLHGTCMGFQTLAILAAQNSSVLATNAYDSENISWPLELTDAAYTSRILGSAPDAVLTTFRSKNSTLNLHHDGVPPEAFASSASLQELMVVLSTNVDRRGKSFVSMMEGRSVPITATQFHPERPIFEHRGNIGINHDYDVIVANRYLGDFFINSARQNTHTFDPALANFSIYGYQTTVEGEIMDGYQAYMLSF